MPTAPMSQFRVITIRGERRLYLIKGGQRAGATRQTMHLIKVL